MKTILSEAIKLPSNRIDADAPLEKYGIDSLMAMQMTGQLEHSFGPLSKTLFFEYRTIAALSGYLLENFPVLLAQLVGIKKPVTEISTDKKLPLYMPSSAMLAPSYQQRFLIKDSRKSAGMQDIAIIGLAGQYPQARNLAEFWQNLIEGKDCITEIPADRWDHSPFYDPDGQHQGKTYAKWGGFLTDADKFDALFFNISPSEAEILDPQERLFLMCVYEALEDAGYTKDSIKSRGNNDQSRTDVGVFAGVMYEEYQLYGAQETSMGNLMVLNGSAASIANRVSYYFDFTGPSMAIDTMCSSSLAAIHLACESLKREECSLAIAGGVNLSLHPNKYLLLGQGKFASTDGRCKSFGKGGDGYVPGEGVGVVLLKPLEKAIKDHDHIYGIVKGASINHGGKTNGYTVPNPDAQAAVIRKAYGNAGVDTAMVSYIEAHGTGTSLGDPIEIAGLTKAFRNNNGKTQYCSIGSVKSNIGHCESAAGIAGLTKVLLQMKYGQIAPSLHSAESNPHIDFTKTPFVVQQKTAKWQRPAMLHNGVTKESLRIAGISSFGAGGSNAHVVIQEYIPQDNILSESIDTYTLPAIVLVSAKSADNLQESVRRLLEHITKAGLTDSDLSHLAYTLQVGREPMEHRLAMLVNTMHELQDALYRFIHGQTADICQGVVKPDNSLLLTIMADADLSKIISSLISKGKYEKLIELWVQGLDVDWNQLYQGEKPFRISLPAYPFTLERYWAPSKQSYFPRELGAVPSQKHLHPLVHENCSDFYTQCFRTTFYGNEFFLKDHIVLGEKVLPGVAYLEMARASVAFALGKYHKEQDSIHLKDVLWINPLTVNQNPVTVLINLTSDKEGVIHFEIVEESFITQAEPKVYCRGSAELHSASAVQEIDLSVLQECCNNKSYAKDQLYKFFAAAGLNYGPAFLGIETVYSGKDELAAKIILPDEFRNETDPYLLHPVMMDAALQATIGFSFDNSNHTSSIRPGLPYALEKVEIYSGCTSPMWAVVRHSLNWIADISGEKHIVKYDIDLCDNTGVVCSRMLGVSFRLFAESQSASYIGSASNRNENQPCASLIEETQELPSESGIFTIAPVWRESIIDPIATKPSYSDHKILMMDMNHLSTDNIISLGNGLHCRSYLTNGDDIGRRYQTYAVNLLSEIQGIMNDKPQGDVLIQVVVPNMEEKQYLTGLSAVLKTARLENPRLIGQVIGIDPADGMDSFLDKLQENRLSPQDSEVVYLNQRRYVKQLDEIDITTENNDMPWRKNGIYLITGGAGGLGIVFAKEIRQRAEQAKVFLVGRSSIDDQKLQGIKELTLHDPHIIYRQVNITDKNSASELIQNIVNECGSIDGIIHSAGVIRDNFILRKNPEELEAVFAPKVTGLMNLDWASRDIPLDFFAFFSSGAAVTGNLGQADYAAANAFMDTYAAYRNTLVKAGKRSGVTVTMNWPLWQDGGMHLNADMENNLLKRTGMKPMPTEIGLGFFNRIISSKKEQVMVLYGDRTRMKELLGVQDSVPLKDLLHDSSSLTSSGSALEFVNKLDTPPALLQEKGIAYLKQLLSPVIKLPVHRIETGIPLERYGINSIMVMKLTDELEKNFGVLPKTLFFEYPSIKDLTCYFISNHADSFSRLVGLIPQEQKNHSEKAVETKFISPLLETRKKPAALRLQKVLQIPKLKETIDSDIAIISLAGRYPQSETIEQFWENLKNGKDCITEIPADRWDHSLIFDKTGKAGKTACKWGGFIKDVDKFDPLFFNISPRDAELMDPQERLFLETVWNLLENAGITAKSLQKKYDSKVGVYVGAMYQQYHAFAADEVISSAVVLSSYHAIANRVSHFFNLEGPSMAIDTACSSALVAIHLACESLKRGECSLAIAGGVNLTIHPKKYIGLSLTQMTGSRADSRSFGDGDGYLPAEGVGAVLLKPLSAAIDDGDNILAVIKSTAMNHNGHAQGYSVPNPNAQARLIEENFRKSGMDPRTITYVESAANGSALGDPIELAALTKAFRAFSQDTAFCAIGSVKSNMGHAEAASGISQLTKTVLQMQHRQLVPSIKAEHLNPNISFKDTPFYLQDKLAEWKQPEININGKKHLFPRRATVSSFGAGGSNAHIIIEEYEENQNSQPQVFESADPQIIIFSARNKKQLHELTRRMLAFIESKDSVSLPDLAFTLQTGRASMEFRMAMIVTHRDELIHHLETYLHRDQLNQKEGGDLVIFTGDCFGADQQFTELLEGTVDEAVIQTLIKEKNLEKIAKLWVMGADIPWEILYPDPGRKILLLPSYPFARQRCWIPVKTESQPADLYNYQDSIKIHKPGFTEDLDYPIEKRLNIFLTQFLERELKLSGDDIDPRRHFQDFGMNSILFQLIIRRIEKQFHIRLTGREIVSHASIESLTALLASKITSQNASDKTAKDGNSISPPVTKFIPSNKNDFSEYCDERIINALDGYSKGSISLENLQHWMESQNRGERGLPR